MIRTSRAGPSCSQEPGTLSASPMWVAGAWACEAFSFVSRYLDVKQRSWNLHHIFGFGFGHFKQWSNYLCHNSNALELSLFFFLSNFFLKKMPFLQDNCRPLPGPVCQTCLFLSCSIPAVSTFWLFLPMHCLRLCLCSAALSAFCLVHINCRVNFSHDVLSQVIFLSTDQNSWLNTD